MLIFVLAVIRCGAMLRLSLVWWAIAVGVVDCDAAALCCWRPSSWVVIRIVVVVVVPVGFCIFLHVVMICDDCDGRFFIVLLLPSVMTEFP